MACFASRLLIIWNAGIKWFYLRLIPSKHSTGCFANNLVVSMQLRKSQWFGEVEQSMIMFICIFKTIVLIDQTDFKLIPATNYDKLCLLFIFKYIKTDERILVVIWFQKNSNGNFSLIFSAIRAIYNLWWMAMTKNCSSYFPSVYLLENWFIL